MACVNIADRQLSIIIGRPILLNRWCTGRCKVAVELIDLVKAGTSFDVVSVFNSSTVYYVHFCLVKLFNHYILQVYHENNISEFQSLVIPPETLASFRIVRSKLVPTQL